MLKKLSKAEDYYRIIRGIGAGCGYLYNSFDVRIDPSCIDLYFKDKQESINVWEDVRALIHKDYNDTSGFLPSSMLCIVSNRLAWLMGTWKPLSPKDKSFYILNIATYPKYFSDSTISTALSKINIKNCLELVEAYGGVENYYLDKGFCKVGNCIRTKRTNINGRTQIIQEKGSKFYKPNNTQYSEYDLLRDCLLIEYPYLKKYDFTSYKLDGSLEFYVKVRDSVTNSVLGTLYIPYDCLKEKTIQPAIDRMTSYFKFYYASRLKELQKNLDLMNSSTFHSLKQDIES